MTINKESKKGSIQLLFTINDNDMMNKEYKNANKNDIVTKHHTSNVESESINNVNTYDKVKAAKANKTIHTENGNINLKHIKILKVNKGTSDFDAKQKMR